MICELNITLPIRLLRLSQQKRPGVLRQPQKGRRPPRLGKKVWGKFRKEATKKYSGTQHAQKVRKKNNESRRKSTGIAQTPEGQIQSWKALLSAGYLENLNSCPRCDSELGQAFVYKENNVVKQCKEMTCRYRCNMMQGAHWLGSTSRAPLSPQKLHTALLMYCSDQTSAPPSPGKVAKVIGTTWKPVARVFKPLHDMEAAAGEDLNEKLVLRNHVEMDATTVRTCQISPRSRTYASLVRAWQQRFPRKQLPNYFLLHIRILGASQRGTNKVKLAPCKWKLTSPCGKPPQESYDEISTSRILASIQARTSCYIDGALGWKKAGKDWPRKSLKWVVVKHSHAEFARKRRQGRTAGTQQLDRQWHHVKKSVPQQWTTTSKGKVREKALWKYLWRGQWRRLNEGHVFASLGKLCKQNRPER